MHSASALIFLVPTKKKKNWLQAASQATQSDCTSGVAVAADVVYMDMIVSL